MSEDGLDLFAKHYKTGEMIPDSLLNKIIEMKTVNSGISTLGQIFYGSYDFYLHNIYVPFQGETTTDVAIRLKGDILDYDVMEDSYFQAAFGHLMHYGSGYYGYMWSKVYAQDMWSKFEEAGPLNPEVGMEYRKKILEPGASRDPMELVKDFLGREPTNDALLRDLGVKQPG